MKSTWSVRTGPYLVETVVPSTMGRMSRCTPSRDTSGPWPPSRPAILSISSMKRMPEVCDALHGQARHLLGVHQPRLLLLQQDLAGLGHGQAAALGAAAEEAGQHVLQVDVHLLDALRAEDLEGGEALLAHLHLDLAVVELARRGAARAASRAWRGRSRRRRRRGRRRRRRRRSPWAAAAAAAGRGAAPPRCARALPWTSACFSRRTMSTAASVRSRTMDSTSRPT